MNKKISLILKILVSATLIYILFRNIPITAIRDAWFGFSIFTILAAVLLHLVALLISAVKWKIFLPEQSFSRLLQFTFIDSFYASVLPGQFTSEVTKAYRLGRRTGDVGRVAVSVWLDKMTGLWSLLVLAIIGLSFASISLSLSVQVIAIAMLAATTICIYFIYTPSTANAISRMINLGGGYLAQKISSFLEKLIGSIGRFNGKPVQIIGSMILGGIYQILSIGITIILARELGVSVSLIDWFWIFGTISVVQLVPISIGGLGVREASFVSLLALFGVASPIALALSLSVFSLQVFYALIGAVVEMHYTATLGRYQMHADEHKEKSNLLD